MIAPFNRTVLSDGDYTLSQGKAWIEVGPYAIRIEKTDEGVVVDVYANGHENDTEIASCYAFDNEIDDLLDECECEKCDCDEED